MSNIPPECPFNKICNFGSALITTRDPESRVYGFHLPYITELDVPAINRSPEKALILERIISTGLCGSCPFLNKECQPAVVITNTNQVFIVPHLQKDKRFLSINLKYPDLSTQYRPYNSYPLAA